MSSDDPAPVEHYAISKLEAERCARAVLEGSGTELVVLRPPLVYGPGCPGNFRSLMSLVRLLPFVPLGGLRRPRSFMYVGNLCDAIEIACLHPSVAGKTYVLSDGVDTSVADTVRALACGYGKDQRRVVNFPYGLLKATAALVGKSGVLDKLANELTIDPSAFMRDTGWTPAVAPDEAMALTARTELLAESIQGLT